MSKVQAPYKPTFLFRKKLLVYPKFQLALLGWSFLVFCTIMTLVATMSFVLAARLRQMGVDAKLVPSHPYFKFMDYQQTLFLQYLAVSLFVGLLVWAAVTLLLSHRMAGPLVRMRNHFEKTAQTGEWNELRFRQGDYFEDMPGIVNRAVEKLTDKPAVRSSRKKAA